MLTSTSCDFFFYIFFFQSDRPTDLTPGNAFDATRKKKGDGLVLIFLAALFLRKVLYSKCLVFPTCTLQLPVHAEHSDGLLFQEVKY